MPVEQVLRYHQAQELGVAEDGLATRFLGLETARSGKTRSVRKT
jgi:hypothetical protein